MYLEVWQCGGKTAIVDRGVANLCSEAVCGMPLVMAAAADTLAL